MRWIRHLLSGLNVARAFPAAVLGAIAKAVARGELDHLGQVCFAVEGGLPLADIVRGRPARDRAHEVFGRLRVWDTEHNSGVLVYVLLADHAIEIIADRGIAARVGQDEWQAACDLMRERFTAAQFERGTIEGVEAVSAILAREFPADGTQRANELSDEPIIL